MLSLLVQSTLFLLFSRNFPNIHCDRIEARPRIVNGVTASNIIPYQASLRVSIRDRASFGRGHTCGAVLISDRVLLTAAHCLYDGNSLRSAFDLRIVLASLNRYHYSSETIVRPLKRIIVHPEYRRGQGLRHDIGILFLRSPVELTNNVQTIGIIDHDVEANSDCEISGWGATQWQGLMPDMLQKANVSIVSRDSCNSSQSYSGTITMGMVCANGISDNGIIDVCQGDSGGPLTCGGRLVGLASFGVQCSFAINFPGVHTNVFYYKFWIDEEILRNSDSRIKLSSSVLSILVINFLIVSLKLPQFDKKAFNHDRGAFQN